MCGLCGYYSFGESRPTIGEIAKMLKAIEIRGKDATGVGLLTDNNKLYVAKAPIEASKFVETKQFKELGTIMPKILMGHTRMKTKGDAKDHNNNHPIIVDDLAIVHNGTIGNDDELIEKYKFKRQGEVDSEILAHLIVKEKYDYKKGIEAIAKECKGSVSMAAISPKHKDKLLLARSGNPVELLLDMDRDILFFASNEESLKEVEGKKKEVEMWRGFEIENSKRMKMLNTDTAVIIGERGLEQIIGFDVKYYVSQVPMYEGYGEYYGSRGWNWYNKKSNSKKEIEKEDFISVKEKWNKLNNGILVNSTCDICKENRSIVKKTPNLRNRYICKHCFYKEIIKEGTLSAGKTYNSYRMCKKCNHWFEDRILFYWGEELYCKSCFKWMQENTCCECWEEPKDKSTLVRVGEDKLCMKCFGHV